MDDQKEIIEKIRKLMALAERGGTEAEGDAAMLKVQELLTKHNLDLDAVRKPEEVTMTREHKEYPWNQSWIRQAYAGIAALYFCKFYYEQQGTDRQFIYLIGEPVNIQTAQYVADIIIATGNRLAKAHGAAVRKEFLEYCEDYSSKNGDSIGKAISAANDFKKGYALRINMRCYELKQAAMTPNPKAPGNQLVVADFYKKNNLAIKEYEQNIGLKLGRGAGMAGPGDKSSANAGASSANAGASAANSVSLTARGIGGGKSGGSLLLGSK